MVRAYVRTYVRTYNVMSQLSDWKRAHMCTENHVCFGRIHGSQYTYVRTTRIPDVRTNGTFLRYHGIVHVLRTYYVHVYVRAPTWALPAYERRHRGMAILQYQLVWQYLVLQYQWYSEYLPVLVGTMVDYGTRVPTSKARQGR